MTSDDKRRVCVSTLELLLIAADEWCELLDAGAGAELLDRAEHALALRVRMCRGLGLDLRCPRETSTR